MNTEMLRLYRLYEQDLVIEYVDVDSVTAHHYVISGVTYPLQTTEYTMCWNFDEVVKLGFRKAEDRVIDAVEELQELRTDSRGNLRGWRTLIIERIDVLTLSHQRMYEYGIRPNSETLLQSRVLPGEAVASSYESREKKRRLASRV